MLNKIMCVLIVFTCSACGDPEQGKAVQVQPNEVAEVKGDLRAGAGMSGDDLKAYAELKTKEFISTFGEQETFVMLGWNQAPSYQPMEHCFDYWYDNKETKLEAQKTLDCEEHVQDLSRLYASYNVEALPVLFKSKYYWERRHIDSLKFPERIREWKANGGTLDDESFRNHPNCAKPLQTGWTGSEYFYDGREKPFCMALKLEALESK